MGVIEVKLNEPAMPDNFLPRLTPQDVPPPAVDTAPAGSQPKRCINPMMEILGCLIGSMQRILSNKAESRLACFHFYHE